MPQTPIEGTSFAYLLDSAGAEAPERHQTQYFEMFGSRAIYHQGWKAVTFKPLGPMYDDGRDWMAPFDDDPWELYHVATDLSETHDLAAEEPDRLAELVARWWEEARAHQVLPLDNRVLYTILNPRPRRRQDRLVYRYVPHGAPVPEAVAADVRNRTHSLLVDATFPSAPDTDGVLLALGSVLGGWSLHVVDGRLRYVHNLYGKRVDVLVADRALEPGRHRVGFSFERTGDHAGDIRLWCDDVTLGTGRIERFTPAKFTGTGVGLTCGYEMGPAVGPGYVAPFRFGGTIHDARVEVTGRPARNPLAEFEAIMFQQ